MRLRVALYSLAGFLALILGIVFLASVRPDWMPELNLPFGGDETEEVEITEYQAPEPIPDEELVDDQITEKNPAFNPDLIDRRPEGDWRLNASAAVLRLDVPMLKPDRDAGLLELRPSYALAMASIPAGMKILASINLIDGKAKQFDDGLFAAIDLAYYQGLPPSLESHVAVVRQTYRRLDPKSAASAYLGGALKIAGEQLSNVQTDKVTFWLNRFAAEPTYSKPFGFYAWSDELSRVFRFMRYLEQPLPREDPTLISDLARAVSSDPKLLDDYQRANVFYARFTNPLEDLTLAEFLKRGGKDEAQDAIAVFPGSRSKETDLFRRLFPMGLSPDADLMHELIRAIRSGKVDLAPKAGSGWYDHQIYALETFLMPERGAESAKLLLTKSYKKRMLEAFQALVTKRRETHARNLKTAEGTAAVRPLGRVKPRLRLEPCPSYYVRTARSYDFLLSFLLTSVGEKGLTSLHGLKEGGERSTNLLAELRYMRKLFYGFHLLSAEDIGMAPDVRTDEPVDRVACEATATKWLDSYESDPDLKVDTRVSVPLYFDVVNRRSRLWATIGVRLAILNVDYAKPPKVKPLQGPGDWEDVKRKQLDATAYLIPVDEFAELDIPGTAPLTREEFRTACDANKSRANLLRALGQRAP
jgi:hypothetical protein